MKKLGVSVLQNVTQQLNQGCSSRQVADRLQVSKSTVNNIRKKLPGAQTMPRSGRPAKLGDRERRKVVSLLIQKKAKTAVDICKLINQDIENKVSPQTVRRVLRNANLKAKKKVKKPRLTRAHKRARYKWALEHKDWTVDDWKRVIWSDETKINRYCSDGIRYSWVPKDVNLSDSMIEPTEKFGGGGVMVWGCMTWAGVGTVSDIVGTMDAKKYCEILESALIPTIEASNLVPDFPRQDQLVFQQDNDAKHTSALAQRWFARHNINVMSWPSKSPDLNPIEHLWHTLKLTLGRYPEPPRGINELKERIKIEWPKIPVEACKTLIESMPRRIAEVIKQKGRSTKY